MTNHFAGKFENYRKAKAGETNCANCALSFHVWYRKGFRCGDQAYNQPVGKLMTCDAAQKKAAEQKMHPTDGGFPASDSESQLATIGG